MPKRNDSATGEAKTSEGRYVLFQESVSSLFLFFYCLGLALTIILQENLFLKVIQFTFFFGVVIFTGRKWHIVGMALLFLPTLIFNIWLKEGRVLFTVVGFSVTADAVIRGLTRGLSLITLFYMSKAFISTKMTFSGPIGFFFAKVFIYFDYFTNAMDTIRLKTLWHDCDRMLLSVPTRTHRPAAQKRRFSSSRMRTYFLYSSVLAVNLIFLILSCGIFSK